jgi:AcrR family transcriptional regulator
MEVESTRRTQAERSEATQAALISTARRLFAERGYSGVGTEEIVRAAGVTRGALYHHFDGKAGLYVAGADDADAARDEMGRVLRGTLEGLRAG